MQEQAIKGLKDQLDTLLDMSTRKLVDEIPLLKNLPNSKLN